MLGGSQLKILLLKNVLNDVTTAPFLVSFSQLLAVKKAIKTPWTFFISHLDLNITVIEGDLTYSVTALHMKFNDEWK